MKTGPKPRLPWMEGVVQVYVRTAFYDPWKRRYRPLKGARSAAFHVRNSSAEEIAARLSKLFGRE